MIVIGIPGVLQVFPVVLEIENNTLLLLTLYCMPSTLDTITDDFILLIMELPIQHRILIVVDFNRGQMLPENIAKVDSLIQKF